MSRNVLLQILGGTKSPAHLRRLVNLWPPFLGAGIRIKHIAPDMKAVDVEMKLRWWNANYVGTHFGGSLFAMTDPFYMLMLMANLGRDYIVWDKAASIRYRKPGKGTVRSRYPFRRIPLCHDRSFLYAHADGKPRPRLHRLGQSRQHPLPQTGEGYGPISVPISADPSLP